MQHHMVFLDNTPEVTIDSLEFEKRFEQFRIVSEYSGEILTLVAMQDGIRFKAYVSKRYAEVLMKEHGKVVA